MEDNTEKDDFIILAEPIEVKSEEKVEEDKVEVPLLVEEIEVIEIP